MPGRDNLIIKIVVDEAGNLLWGGLPALQL
jgi:hypothetical protein